MIQLIGAVCTVITFVILFCTLELETVSFIVNVPAVVKVKLGFAIELVPRPPKSQANVVAFFEHAELNSTDVPAETVVEEASKHATTADELGASLLQARSISKNK